MKNFATSIVVYALFSSSEETNAFECQMFQCCSGPQKQYVEADGEINLDAQKESSFYMNTTGGDEGFDFNDIMRGKSFCGDFCDLDSNCDCFDVKEDHINVVRESKRRHQTTGFDYLKSGSFKGSRESHGITEDTRIFRAMQNLRKYLEEIESHQGGRKNRKYQWEDDLSYIEEEVFRLQTAENDKLDMELEERLSTLNKQVEEEKESGHSIDPKKKMIILKFAAGVLAGTAGLLFGLFVTGATFGAAAPLGIACATAISVTLKVLLIKLGNRYWIQDKKTDGFMKELAQAQAEATSYNVGAKAGGKLMIEGGKKWKKSMKMEDLGRKVENILEECANQMY